MREEFQQLVANFADFWRSNNVFMQNRIMFFKKKSATRKINISEISRKFRQYLVK